MRVYLGLGSNIGSRKSNIQKAVHEIKSDPHFKDVRVSRFYETLPIGPKQRKFINAALSAVTELEPEELLKTVKRLEKELGRKDNAIKWGPRKIDIDILFFGEKVIATKTLTVPHQELAKRLFVLFPLCDIAADVRHPVLKKTVLGLKNDALLTCREQKDKIPICRIK